MTERVGNRALVVGVCVFAGCAATEGSGSSVELPVASASSDKDAPTTSPPASRVERVLHVTGRSTEVAGSKDRMHLMVNRSPGGGVVLYTIEGKTGRLALTSLGPGDAYIVRGDPLVVYDDAKLAGLGERFEPRWSSPPLPAWPNDCYLGQLVVLKIHGFSGGMLLGLDPSTGAERFKAALSEGRVYTGAGTDLVLVTDRQDATVFGSEAGKVTKIALGGRARGAYVTPEGPVIATDQALVAFTPEGKQRWSRAGSVDFVSRQSVCPYPARVSGRTLLTYEAGRGYVGVDARTGAERWHLEVETATGKDGDPWPSTSWRQPGGLFVHADGGSRIIDEDSGKPVFECTGCRALQMDGDDVLVQSHAAKSGNVELMLRARDGSARWQRPITVAAPEERSLGLVPGFMPRPYFAHAGATLLDQTVAICVDAKTVAFFERATGASIAEERLPNPPEGEEPRCWLNGFGRTVVADDAQGVSVFHVAGSGAEDAATPAAAAAFPDEICACKDVACADAAMRKLHTRSDPHQRERLEKCLAELTDRGLESFLSETCACEDMKCVDSVGRDWADFLARLDREPPQELRNRYQVCTSAIKAREKATKKKPGPS